jgi:hypothetical protein
MLAFSWTSRRATVSSILEDLCTLGVRETDYDYNTEKRYTLILKDTLLSRDPDSGREQATISWECDFDLPPQTIPGDTKDRTIFIPWDSLNPTYRGKLKKDAEPLDLKKIKRFSIMMRRYACSYPLYNTN